LNSKDLFLFLSVFIIFTSCSLDCPENWVDAADKCYLFGNSQTLSWLDAQIFCQTLGGHLAEPITEERSNLLTSIASIETDVLGVNAWWLGLSDLGHEGRWIWQSALEEAVYTDWAEGFPIDDGVENNCASMKAENDLKWSDESCTDTRASPICETEDVLANPTTNDPPSTTPSGEIIMDGPYGGSGGHEFTDQLFYEQFGDITAVRLQGGDFVDFIQLKYGDTWALMHGGVGGNTEAELELSAEERIITVEGEIGAASWLNKISFLTNNGNTIGPVGSYNGEHFTSSSTGCSLAYISGRAGSGVDAITLYWKC